MAGQSSASSSSSPPQAGSSHQLGDAPHNDALLEGGEDDGAAGPLLVNKLEVSARRWIDSGWGIECDC